MAEIIFPCYQQKKDPTQTASKSLLSLTLHWRNTLLVEKHWALALTKLLNHGQSFLVMGRVFCDKSPVHPVLFWLWLAQKHAYLIEYGHTFMSVKAKNKTLHTKKGRTQEEFFCSTEALMVGHLANAKPDDKVLDVTRKEQWWYDLPWAGEWTRWAPEVPPNLNCFVISGQQWILQSDWKNRIQICLSSYLALEAFKHNPKFTMTEK